MLIPSGLAMMIVLNGLLVTWWLLAAGIIISLVVGAQRRRVADQRAAIVAHLKGHPIEWMPRPEASSRRAFHARLAAVSVLIVGLFVWMALWNWTALLLWNVRGLLMLGFVALAATAFAPNPFTSGWPRVMVGAARPLALLIGLIGGGFMTYFMGRELLLPRIAVEGRVDALREEESGRFSPKYLVVIDGRTFRATRAAQKSVSIGDHVHAEIGAQSGMLVQMRAIGDAAMTERHSRTTSPDHMTK